MINYKALAREFADDISSDAWEMVLKGAFEKNPEGAMEVALERVSDILHSSIASLAFALQGTSEEQIDELNSALSIIDALRGADEQ